MDKFIQLISKDKEGNDITISLSFQHAENVLILEAARKQSLHSLKDKSIIFKNGKIIKKETSVKTIDNKSKYKDGEITDKSNKRTNPKS